jgi:hypothetical protein
MTVGAIGHACIAKSSAFTATCFLYMLQAASADLGSEQSLFYSFFPFTIKKRFWAAVLVPGTNER